VLVLHGIEAWQRLSMADRIAARCASLTIATTEFTARRFAEINGYPVNRILVVPLAVEEDSIPQPALARPRHDMRVLTVGRLSRLEQYKGVDHLIDAVAALAKTGTPVTLDIVGDGDDSPALKQRAIRAGAQDAIRFHGAVPDDRLRDLYRSSDVFAMPSLNEGFGIVFLEAMCYGKPCIGGRHGGTPEVVQDGFNGLLVQHGDVNHLIGCLRELYSNPDLRRRLGERAYQTVVGKFLRPRMQADWFRVLDTAFRASEQTNP
jgi:glycosyltransferase involved in cell wall biosynthesis